jgi:hypothetical protein
MVQTPLSTRSKLWRLWSKALGEKSGDIEISVLNNSSPYMKKMYDITDLLKV